jgi:hypothetical protein
VKWQKPFQVMSDTYFKFPLAVLRVGHTQLECLEMAVSCGIVNAGTGTRQTDPDAFAEMLAKIATERRLDLGEYTEEQKNILVGAKVTNTSLGGYSPAHLTREIKNARRAPVGPLVNMKTDFLWEAVYRARSVAGQNGQGGSISFLEFAVLCAIYSAPWNKRGFWFGSYRTIRARACGFTGPDEFDKAKETPPAIGTAWTRHQIETTLAKLEELKFFLRFRYSVGMRGGRLAYSIKHAGDRKALAKDVLAFVDRNQNRRNRAEDAALIAEIRAEMHAGTKEK